MPTCPKCTSPSVVSGKFVKDEYIDKAVGFAHAVQTFGDRRFSALAGLGALALKGVNALCKDYRCVKYGHTFDVDELPGHAKA